MKKLKKSKLNSNEDSSTKVKEVQDGLALMSGPINNKDNVQPSTELSHLSKNDASTLASSKSKYKYKKSKDNKKRANDEVSTKLTCQITSMERTISDLVQSFNSFRELAMEKLVANEENWRQLKTANETSKVSKAPIDVNDIRRPPPVGYVRVDNDMIHLGRGIWLPQATFNNDIYTAGSSLAMVVKNIAVSVFGVEYLKSHSVKGKGSNKTKSIPRPAIDPTKALAIRDIFEYYLKTERKMTGQALMNEVDLYEEYIRQKISDLLRPPRQANKNNKKSEASQKNVTHDKNDVPAAASGT
ncbi:uncharacterized protein LOC141537231 isoform X2 [Cotesia typhae]|uniref:uncharacterized protein LOC141537231 isoform X2 n=1 Tax=Cotesia typhae TaxID=2053667 RepID=UPI003D68B0C5